MGTILSLSGVSKRFGGLWALDDVSMDVREGEILSVIGPNGAGKSTLFNVITRVSPQTSGTIVFGGVVVRSQSPHEVVRLGVARTFQKVRLFRNLSVRDNVMAGIHVRHEPRLWEGLTARARKTEGSLCGEVDELLRFVGLDVDPFVPAGSLSYGFQRLVEIARALATKPRLLLLDEPAAGLNPDESLRLTRVIKSIQARGIAVMLVEHDVALVMGISDRVVVLNFGKKIFEGPPEKARTDPSVIEAYLGRE